MGKSLKEYIPAILHWWWVIVVFMIGDVAGIALTMLQNIKVPFWVWILVFIIGLVIAQFFAFHDLRKKRDELQHQLIEIRNACPNIEFDTQVAPEHLTDVISHVVVGIPLFAKLLVTNNPTSVLDKVDAPNVATHIEILDNNRSLFPRMVGRWANTKHQYQGALPNQVAQMALHPNGLSEPLLIALKYTDEDSAYGLNVDNEKMSGWRDPKKNIPIGTWRVKVHLQGNNVDETVWLNLTNKGKGTDIELERESTPVIPDKECSQT